MKVTVIGAGSTYTPELVEGFIRFHHKLPVSELALVDIDQRRLRILSALTRRMVAASGLKIKVSAPARRSDAIRGSSFVLTQIRVGGQKARHRDTLLGLSHGVIGQETVGVGGFAKAMRTIPVVLDICKEMRRLAPRAWMLNFTNPSGMVTEAILKYGGVKAIGLCNSPYGIQTGVASLLKVPAASVVLDYVGLNHLGFVGKVRAGGKDVTLKVLKHFNKIKKAANIKKIQYDQAFLDALGMLPNSYLQYYYLPDELVAELKAEKQTRAQDVMKVEAELMRMYQDPRLDHKPPELAKRGGANYSTVAVSLMVALHTNARQRHIVNVRNGDALPDLPPDSVVEVPCIIGRQGARPIKMGRMDARIRGIIAQVKAYEELSIRASVERSYDLALMALVNNPLVPSAGVAKKLLDSVIRMNHLKFR